VVTRRLQAERRTGSVRRPKTGVLPTVLPNQLQLQRPLDVDRSSLLCLYEANNAHFRVADFLSDTDILAIGGQLPVLLR